MLLFILISLFQRSRASAIHPRIVNGDLDVHIPTRTPYIALSWNATTPYVGCGSTLIHPSWLVTAAHCVVYENGIASPGSAIANITQDNGVDEYIVVRTPVMTIAHPNYTYAEAENDIALIKLDAPFENHPIASIDVHGSQLRWGESYKDCLNNECDSVEIVGFGVDDLSEWKGYSERQKADLYLLKCPIGISNIVDKFMSTTTCPAHRCTQFCAIHSGNETDYEDDYVDNIDACYGDSGGPAFSYDGDDPNLLGIVSWGLGCALGVKRYAGVYTYVPHYLQWMRDVTGESFTKTSTRITIQDNTFYSPSALMVK